MTKDTAEQKDEDQDSPEEEKKIMEKDKKKIIEYHKKLHGNFRNFEMVKDIEKAIREKIPKVRKVKKEERIYIFLQNVRTVPMAYQRGHGNTKEYIQYTFGFSKKCEPRLVSISRRAYQRERYGGFSSWGLFASVPQEVVEKNIRIASQCIEKVILGAGLGWGNHLRN